MIISKQMAAILGGLFFAAVLGIQLYGCDTANAQQAATERDYALLNPQVADDTADAALRDPCRNRGLRPLPAHIDPQRCNHDSNPIQKTRNSKGPLCSKSNRPRLL